RGALGAGLLQVLFERRVGVVDRAPGGGVARGALRRLVLRGPGLGGGELLLERDEGRLGGLDRLLELGGLADRVLGRRGGRRGGGRGALAVPIAVAVAVGRRHL